jgi:hypothetical protein
VTYPTGPTASLGCLQEVVTLLNPEPDESSRYPYFMFLLVLSSNIRMILLLLDSPVKCCIYLSPSLFVVWPFSLFLSPLHSITIIIYFHMNIAYGQIQSLEAVSWTALVVHLNSSGPKRTNSSSWSNPTVRLARLLNTNSNYLLWAGNRPAFELTLYS